MVKIKDISKQQAEIGGGSVTYTLKERKYRPDENKPELIENK